jgi:hypothetical protein
LQTLFILIPSLISDPSEKIGVDGMSVTSQAVLDVLEVPHCSNTFERRRAYASPKSSAINLVHLNSKSNKSTRTPREQNFGWGHNEA